ncbi:MAG: hypothetical protein JWM85_531, partial [Acidimicrobiaceae bacterium]|nr:hypothetical protein [Acidimicrobiaceae bacterium]
AVPGAAPLVRAAIVELSRQQAFRTVRDAPSLRVVTLVEPTERRQAATLSFTGPKGRGTLRVTVVSGEEYLEGDRAGWQDFLLQNGASSSMVAAAASFGGTWYQTASPVTFGPTLSGIGHVLCAGAACSLAGAKVLAYAARSIVSVPGLGGRLVLGPGIRPRPLALVGTGSRSAIELRFVYLTTTPPVLAPAQAAPLPAALAG